MTRALIIHLNILLDFDFVVSLFGLFYKLILFTKKTNVQSILSWILFFFLLFFLLNISV